MLRVSWSMAAAAAALWSANLAGGQPADGAGAEAPPAEAATEVSPAERLARAADAAAAHVRAIESAHLRFRRTRMTGPFKDDISPARFDELLKAHDLVARPESLRELLLKLLATETVADEPWSEMELHTIHPGTPQQSVRETRANRDGEPDVHVVTPEVSLRWDEANSQLNVDAARDNRVAYTRLAEFRRPAPANLPHFDVRDEQVDGRAALRVANAPSASSFAIDAKTGFMLGLDSHRADQVELSRWLGWQDNAGGIPFPRAVANARFVAGKLRWIDICLVLDARFNAPLAPTVFQLGAPAGSVIVDSRRQGGVRAVRINRDLFDASSAEQITDAVKPLDEEFTQTELDAFEELRRNYVLADGQTIRRFVAPFPLSRKYLPRMLSPRTVDSRRKFRYDVLELRDGRLGSRTDYSSNSGTNPRILHLVTLLLNQPETDIDIAAEVLQRAMPGDYLVRHGAMEEELADGLSEILSHELQRPVRLVFRETERRIFVARGRLDINKSLTTLRDDRPQIAVNGGNHTGDHGESIGFGRLDDLLRDLGDYIGHKIVDKTDASELDLAWSKRWYDLESTPADKRFQLDLQEVVKMVAAQTGLAIEPDVQRVRVLRLLDK